MKRKYYLNEPCFRVGNIDVQRVQRQKGYKHSFLSGREKNGFIYVVSGKLLDSFCNESVERLTVECGELIFIPCGSVYTGTYLEDATEIKIVQFDIISGELPHYLSSPAKIELPYAHEWIERFFPSATHSASHHPFYYLSCLYELLWRIDESRAALPKKYKKLHPAFSALSKEWNKNEKVARYASLCDISEATFRRLFLEYAGVSFIAYRNDMRLTNAKSKLQSGEYTVSEAAYECGFSNLSFFIRSYKKKYGHTPRQEG